MFNSVSSLWQQTADGALLSLLTGQKMTCWHRKANGKKLSLLLRLLANAVTFPRDPVDEDVCPLWTSWLAEHECFLFRLSSPICTWGNDRSFQRPVMWLTLKIIRLTVCTSWPMLGWEIFFWKQTSERFLHLSHFTFVKDTCSCRPLGFIPWSPKIQKFCSSSSPVEQMYHMAARGYSKFCIFFSYITVKRMIWIDMLRNYVRLWKRVQHICSVATLHFLTICTQTHTHIKVCCAFL